MKHFKLLVMAAFVLSLASCGGNTKDEQDYVKVKKDKNGAVVFDLYVSYKKDSLRLEDVADIEYLKLDNKAGDVALSDWDLQWADWCSITSNDIFIKGLIGSKNKLFHFNRAGKYLGTLDKKGKGSDEYQTMRDLAIDTIKKEVVVYDSFNHAFKYYNYNFKYLRTVVSEFKDIDKFFFFGSPDAAFCTTNIMTREKTGVSHVLVSLKDGKLLKEYHMYRKQGKVCFGGSTNGCSERNLVSGKDGIYMSDLACYDTVYVASFADSLIHPAYYKLSTSSETQLQNRTYLYMLFDTDRYAQFIRYKDHVDQFWYVYDKQTEQLSFSSLYSNDSKIRGRRWWWNIPANDNIIVRAEKLEPLLKGRRDGHYTGKFGDFIDNQTDEKGWVLQICKFKPFGAAEPAPAADTSAAQ